MPPKKTDDKKVTVVAESTVTWYEDGNGQKEIVKSLDKAWHKAISLPLPVNIHFNGFVRKD